MKAEKKLITEADFLNQEGSKYNRFSGQRTLVLVSILIFIVIILSIATILII